MKLTLNQLKQLIKESLLSQRGGFSFTLNVIPGEGSDVEVEVLEGDETVAHGKGTSIATALSDVAKALASHMSPGQKPEPVPRDARRNAPPGKIRPSFHAGRRYG